MDERIIYVIFILLWAAYKLYQKSRKVKNNSEKKLSPNPQPPTPNFKSIFEKILLGEEFTMPAKTKDNEELEMRNEELEIENSTNQQINKATIDYQETKLSELKETIKTEVLSSKFNLKQAIIYSVIINRPYQ